MKRNLKALTQSQFDVVVIGGGIFGTCTAWDAVERGLSVALVERADFGGATSANSFRFIHGGIRYLQHADFHRIRQSAEQRRLFLKVAPHLVRPQPIAIPTYGHGMKGKAALRIGMGIYDLTTIDSNRGIRDRNRKIPWGKCVSRETILSMFPGLKPDGLTGAAIFSDAQMHNPPRLTLAFLQSAVEAGAVAANYVEATGILREGNRAIGVQARDVLSGNDLEVRGRVVINAAGPYAERLLAGDSKTEVKTPGTYSRDTCFIVPRRLLGGNHALAVQGATRDPDAVVGRGERHLFIVPWRDYTLVGVWHGVHRDDPDAFTVTEAELEKYLEEVNAAYPGLGLSLDDIALWNAGLVPFGDNAEGAVHLRYGHRSRVIDHAKQRGLENLVTLIGVRYTTGRCDAREAVNLAFRKLGRKAPRTRPDRAAVFGGKIDDFEQYVQSASALRPTGITLPVMRSLVNHYGSEHSRVLRHVDRDRSMSDVIGDSTTIKAQIREAVDGEMAQTLGDVVFRRTDLATGNYPGRAALETSAQVLANELDWNSERIEREIEQVTARFLPSTVKRVDESGTRCEVKRELHGTVDPAVTSR